VTTPMRCNVAREARTRKLRKLHIGGESGHTSEAKDAPIFNALHIVKCAFEDAAAMQ